MLTTAAHNGPARLHADKTFRRDRAIAPAAVAQLGDMATASQKHVSMATKAGLRHKDVRNPLKFALGTYFTIWMCYPLLWLLLEGKLITPTISHCCHVVMDVLAKSMYGFALLRFQLLVDKTQVPSCNVIFCPSSHRSITYMLMTALSMP